MIRNRYHVRVWIDGALNRTLNKERHCDTGPAYQRINGYKEWWTHGELIRWGSK